MARRSAMLHASRCRRLLDKSVIFSEEIAHANYGLDLAGVPVARTSRIEVRRKHKHKLDRAIDYLARLGYEVRRHR